MAAPVKLLNVERTGERFVLGVSEYLDAIQDTTVTDCELVFDGPASARNRVLVDRSTFVRCRFVAKRPLTRAVFEGTFTECSFRGAFAGCTFGGPVAHDRRRRPR